MAETTKVTVSKIVRQKENDVRGSSEELALRNKRKNNG
jgi:hypothetical protein